MTEEGVAYMKRQNAIVEEKGKNILAIMPLVTTYCEQQKDVLQLFTDGTRTSELEESEQKMNLSLTVDKYLKDSQQEAPTWNKYLKNLSALDVSISNDDKVKAEILFQNDRNALVTLLD